MNILVLGLKVKLLISALIVFFAAVQASSQDEVTWSDQIACLIYSHCSSCHNDNGIAPFSLTSYDKVRSFRFAIEDVITRGEMPPWPANPSYRHYIDENVLSQEEIDLFQKWVSQGAQEGDPNRAPEVPQYSGGAEIQNPDLVLKLPVYEVPPLNDKDLYRCFVFDIDMPQDFYITAFEVIPGNPSIVHHALIYESSSGLVPLLDKADPEPGYICFGGIGVADVTGIGGWVPGSKAEFFPEGMGMKIPGKTRIVVQVHYPEYGAGEIDSTKVLFKISNGPLRELANAPILNHNNSSLVNGPLFIPANTVRTFENRFTVPVKASIYSITPHAHLICESMSAYGITPTGDTLKFIDIPKWDFDWQKTYHFKKPIVIPAGTVLHGFATYNNTSANDHNPNIPPKNVQLGEATTDEMMLFYFTFSGYENGDESVIFDDRTHLAHHEDCVYDIVSSNNDLSEHHFQVFPNPASKSVRLQHSYSEGEIVVYNALGQILHREVIKENTSSLNVSDWESGLYFITIHSGLKSFTERLMVTRNF